MPGGRLVDLKPRPLDMPDHPLGEQLPGIVGRVLAHDPAQQIAAARDRKADRESSDSVLVPSEWPPLGWWHVLRACSTTWIMTPGWALSSLPLPPQEIVGLVSIICRIVRSRLPA